MVIRLPVDLRSDIDAPAGDIVAGRSRHWITAAPGIGDMATIGMQIAFRSGTARTTSATHGANSCAGLLAAASVYRQGRFIDMAKTA